MEPSEKPWRIALLSLHSSPIGPLGTQNTGGMSVYVRELAKWMGHHGHHIDIFTYTRGPCRQLELYPNVRLIHLLAEDAPEPSKQQMPMHLPNIFQLMDQYRQDNGIVYDLIHSHYWLSGVVGTMAQNQWNCPHLTMFHTLGAEKNHTPSRENEPIRRIAHERWLAKAADGIVVPAARERHNLLCHYHPPADKIHTIPCGVDLDRFHPMDRRKARRDLSIAEDDQVALYVGRFAPVKGIDYLLEAVGRLKERWPRLKLVIVGGEGPAAESARALKAAAHGHGIAHRTLFAGRVDQEALPSFYNAADFLALPSHYESFGLVILEALACNTPVITTPGGATDTVIQEGVNGLIIHRADGTALADAIERMLEMQHRPIQAADTIRATVRNFSWQRVAEAVMQTYARLLKTHRRQPHFNMGTGRLQRFQT